MKLFKRKIKKYKVMYLQAHERDFDRKLNLCQDKGYEICGDVVLKLFNEHSSDVTFFVPMRKLI